MTDKTLETTRRVRAEADDKPKRTRSRAASENAQALQDHLDAIAESVRKSKAHVTICRDIFRAGLSAKDREACLLFLDGLMQGIEIARETVKQSAR